MSEKRKLTPVSKASPCPVCGGDHKCSHVPGGFVLCGRSHGPVAGYVYLGPAKSDPQWGMYRPEVVQPVAPVGQAFLPAELSQAGRNACTTVAALSARELAERFATHLLPLRAADLAHRIGLPTDALALMPLIGYKPDESCWTFPEFDSGGRVIGLLRRFPDGSKRSFPNLHRGLSLAGGWADADGPLFVVEGPTDTLALARAHLGAVGRPSNTGAVDHLAALFARISEKRMIVVVGENDRKPDGKWPGADGAKLVADGLTRRLRRPIYVTMPPPQYKDVRDWVTDRWQGAAEGFDWPTLGREIARDLVGAAVQYTPPETKRGEVIASFDGTVLVPRKYPLPTPVTELELPGPGGVEWVWDGFLARDAVTLLSALPKCGKTTLLGHLLAALTRGGDFCGRALIPGRAVVVSEEPGGVWASRREELGLEAAVRVIPRGRMPRCASLDDWTGFINFLLARFEDDPADLVVFDTLANLWPVKDENSAAEVGAALAPMHQLAAGRSVLLVHHLRKSDGNEGTGSRGSGALGGFVDVIAELRRLKPSIDPGQRRRAISGYGRYDAIPNEWVVELVKTDNGKARFLHCPDGVGTRGAERDTTLRHEIIALLGAAKERGEGLTRKQLWDGLPEGVRRNEMRFKEVIEAGVGVLWRKEERANSRGGAVYRLGV